MNAVFFIVILCSSNLDEITYQNNDLSYFVLILKYYLEVLKTFRVYYYILYKQ